MSKTTKQRVNEMYAWHKRREFIGKAWMTYSLIIIGLLVLAFIADKLGLL